MNRELKKDIKNDKMAFEAFNKLAVLENEDQLFIYTNKENMFNKSKMMLPLLSHA